MVLKPSDLEELPEGWKNIDLGSIMRVRQGLQIPISQRLKKPTPTAVEYITIQSIKNKNQEREYVESPSRRVVCEVDDVLMTRTGNTGIVVTGVEGAFHNNFFLMDFERSLVNRLFLVNYLRSPRVQHLILVKAGSSTIPDLNHRDFYSIRFPLPPLAEQKKIAQILSTWDKAITTTERLLVNSQQQKKALMQKLLTGKKRLLDENGVRFSGEWECFTLNDLFTFKRGKGLSKSDISTTGKNRCVLYGELYTRYAEVIDNVYSRTDKNEAELSESGDILIPSSTTTSGIDLANATAILENGVLLGGDINILRPRSKLSSQFMAHVLTHIKRYEIASLAQGITIIHLYGSDLKKLKVWIPRKLDEQIKISQVLSAIDKASLKLQIKFDILKQEKKSLMQQLLTGKRRVKVDEEAV